jgi:carboxyl-terminal processing protease
MTTRAASSPLRWVGCLALLLLGVTLFLGGIAVERYFLSDGLLATTEAAGDAAGLDAALLDEARRVIQENFVDRAAATDERLQTGALSGMVDILGDIGHSRFMTPAMVEEQANYIAGEFEGIGAYVEMRDGFVTIVSPIDNSPAQAAGILPGDVVTAVDGQDVTGLSLQEVVDMILGPAGTPVTITLFRPETSEELTLTLERARIELQNVTWTMLPGTTIAQVRIAGFSERVADDLAAAIEAATAQGASGLILDLRNNPGGLLSEAVSVAGRFLPDDTVVVLRQDADGDITEERTDNAAPTLLPLVVLINQGSASASEIVSGALQDHGRATLVGETTFGTGTVLNEFGLSDGSAILLATEQWLTPDGRVIWREGVVPDEVVELTGPVQLLVPETADDLTAEEVAASEDGQVLRAVELLRSQ